MGTYLDRGEGKGLIPKVNSVLGFEITKKKGEKPALIYEIDLFLSLYNFKRVITNMTHHGWGDALYITTDN